MSGTLEGKTVIVTGAAKGLGRAIALRFAKAGARLMLTDPNDTGLNQTVEEIGAEPGQIARFAHATDDKLGVSNLIAATIDNFGQIDVLVTRSRVADPGVLLDLSSDAFDSALSLNVRSVFLQSKLVARRMIQQREADPQFSGALVNMSSIAARRTTPDLLAYSVSCAALDQLTRSMAASLAPRGIRVNAVAVGSVLTATLQTQLRDDAELRDEMIGATPLGRLGEAAEAAETALFLASPAASFVTGQIIAVDGGRLAFDRMSAPVR